VKVRGGQEHVKGEIVKVKGGKELVKGTFNDARNKTLLRLLKKRRKNENK